MSYTITKYTRGFKVTHGRVSSYPWIPKWYLKWMYPWFILKAARLVKSYE